MLAIRNAEDLEHGLAQLVKIDPVIRDIAAQVGEIPLRLERPNFATLCRIVIGQQVSRASAAAIHQRFCEHIDPITAESFVAAGEPAWIRIGLSRAKQKTLHEVARAIMEGHLNLSDLATRPAADSMLDLTAIHGIGPWTAEVFLLFGAGHPDIFPAGDLALRQAVTQVYSKKHLPDEKSVRVLAENWSPYRGIAARVFWAYYGTVMNQGRFDPV